MTDKLAIYNGALRLLGERRLRSLTENVPSRHHLDSAWDDDFVKGVLEEGYWRFATRSIQATYNSAVEPEFGYPYAFDKPEDYVKLAAISTDEFFQNTLMDYSEEGDYWFTNYDLIYIQYISTDSAYGNDMARWPKSFIELAEAMLADDVKELITGNDMKFQTIKKVLKDAKTNARSKDLMNQPQKKQQRGSFVKARMNSSVNNDGN